MTGSSGNGDPPERYTCHATEFYGASRAFVEETFPRTRQIRLFDQIEACVQLLPPDETAERLDGSTWLLVTQEGANVPEVNVFYLFQHQHVTLEAAFVDI